MDRIPSKIYRKNYSQSKPLSRQESDEEFELKNYMSKSFIDMKDILRHKFMGKNKDQ